MKESLTFLSVEQVLEVHRRGIEEHGGSLELRDRGLLESAVAMPKSQFGGQFLHNGLPAMAATYLFHLCKNHPFVDGNKRLAVAAAETFVLVNDHELNATDEELEVLTLGIADSSLSKEDAIAFFRRHVRKGKPSGSRLHAPVKPAKRTPPRRKKKS